MESELSSTGFLSDCVRFHFLINSIEQKGVKMERLFKIIISFALYGAKHYSSLGKTEKELECTVLAFKGVGFEV